MKHFTGIPRDQDARRLALVTLLVVFLLAIQPWLWGRVFDAAAHFRNQQTQQEQLANVVRLTEAIRASDGNQQALLDQAGVAFPLLESTSHVVERVEALAEGQGLTLELLSITEVKPRASATRPAPALTPFDIALLVVGPPRAVLAFLEAVEHMQELTAVESFTIEAIQSQTPGVRLYAMNMKIRFFLQPSL